MRIQLEAAQVGGVQTPNAPQLPPGVDPDDNVTVAQLQTVVANMQPLVRAEAIRSTWGIPPADEQRILQENPVLQNTPEPNRTLLIQRAYANLQKVEGAPSGQGSESAVTPAIPTRDIEQRVVPHVEATPTPGASGEPGVGESNVEKAARMYHAVDADTTLKPKEKTKRKRYWYEQWESAQGIQRGDMLEQSFTQKSSLQK